MRRKVVPKTEKRRAFIDADIPTSFPNADIAVLSVSLQLITPMFGGGVVSAAINRRAPFSAEQIKHHLRWWWRRLARYRLLPIDEEGGFLDAKSGSLLYEVERALFGGLKEKTSVPSKVRVEVSAENVSNEELKVKDPDWPRYALFPALNKSDQKWLLTQGKTFDVRVHCPTNAKQQIIEAMRWWIQFGGVGARSRRGAGSVSLVEQTVHEALAKEITKSEAALCGIVLKTSLVKNDAIEAWREAVEWLRRFRQGHDAHGLISSTGALQKTFTPIGKAVRPLGTPVRSRFGFAYRPGRSRWPDADNVRVAGGLNGAKRRPVTPPPAHMPKTAFGLPIVGNAINQTHGSTPTHKFRIELLTNGDSGGRIPSPITLKARSCIRNRGLMFEAIALMFTDEADKALAQTVRVSVTERDQATREPRMRDFKVFDPGSPMPPPASALGSGSDPDPLRAFMSFFGDSTKARDFI
jgi:CRISPR-associated protein Cmr1